MATVARLRGLRDSVWLEQGKYEQAEGRYQEALARNKAGGRAGEERGSAVCDSIGATMSMIQLSLSANPQVCCCLQLCVCVYLVSVDGAEG